MWDDISLSDLEEQVIEAAKIIDSRVQGIRTFLNGEIVVKVDGVENRLPLGTLGEGVSQMLVIALTVRIHRPHRRNRHQSPFLGHGEVVEDGDRDGPEAGCAGVRDDA
jgi:hypothetical protein